MSDDAIRVGISSCLLGNRVRHDGGHKLDCHLRDTIGALVEWIPVCPEVEYGLPIPREALRLVGDPADPRLVAVISGVDHTAGMNAWATMRLDALERAGLRGFVFKSRSPSCGMRQVKVYPREGGIPSAAGVGIFARAFMERFPLPAVEDEDRLSDADSRINSPTVWRRASGRAARSTPDCGRTGQGATRSCSPTRRQRSP